MAEHEVVFNNYSQIVVGTYSSLNEGLKLDYSALNYVFVSGGLWEPKDKTKVKLNDLLDD